MHAHTLRLSLFLHALVAVVAPGATVSAQQIESEPDAVAADRAFTAKDWAEAARLYAELGEQAHAGGA